MSKPKAELKDIVLFQATKQEQPNVAERYPDDHDLVFAAIVNRASEGDDCEANLTVFLDGGGIKPVKNVPYATYASDEQARWKKGS